MLLRVSDGAKGFDAFSWRKHTAENMWSEAVGPLIDAKNGALGITLREALSLSAAGAHDSSARGLTDLETALETIRETSALFSIVD